MKILVTGGTGVVGAAAVVALLRDGHEIRLLSRHASHETRSFPHGVEGVDADIAEHTGLGDAVAGCAAVLHIAGIVEESPPDVTFERVNVGGTRHLLEAATAAGAPTFVHVSSLGAERGESAYHHSKRAAEALVRAYAGPWVILRPGNVYGPGDETISMLLKMVRGLPAVPMVDDGEQPFQPIWCGDFARVIAQIVESPACAGRTLELAGAEITTTNDVLDRLCAITARHPPRLPVPAWLARVGTGALEAFGGWGKRWLQNAGLEMPINSGKLRMLQEGNVIDAPGRNALLTEFSLTPTTLQEGLEMLADELPEQIPGDGVGAMKVATYSAEIDGTTHSARTLLDEICERITEVMPIEFAAEPGAPTQAKEGETMTAEIKGRGKVQVRLEERTPGTVTFVTIEGHPLAGVMQLCAEDRDGGVRFAVRTAAQPANAFDWVALRTVGETLQMANWRSVVRRVVALSGGEAPAGVEQQTHRLDSAEARELNRWVEALIQRRQREQRTEEVAGVAAPATSSRPHHQADR